MTPKSRSSRSQREIGTGKVLAVGSTNAPAGMRSRGHLTSLGHRRIGFVKGPPEHRAAAARDDAVCRVCCGRPGSSMSLDGNRRLHVQVRRRCRRAACFATAFRFTALACANDDMAAGVMLALHRAGRDIPDGISVTGFDDTPMSRNRLAAADDHSPADQGSDGAGRSPAGRKPARAGTSIRTCCRSS